MTTSQTYSEIRRSIDPRDGALRVVVRPLTCSHDEHTVTVYREYAVDDGSGGAPEWVEYNWGGQAFDGELQSPPITSPFLRYRAAIEDDVVDAEFSSAHDSIGEAITHALVAPCERDDVEEA